MLKLCSLEFCIELNADVTTQQVTATSQSRATSATVIILTWNGMHLYNGMQCVGRYSFDLLCSDYGFKRSSADKCSKIPNVGLSDVCPPGTDTYQQSVSGYKLHIIMLCI